jgi:hypothetical protein
MLAQRYGSELAAEIPEVDAFVGIQAANQIADVLWGAQTAKAKGGARTLLPMMSATIGASDKPAQGNLVAPLTEKYPLIPPGRVLATAPWTAYLKSPRAATTAVRSALSPLSVASTAPSL